MEDVYRTNIVLFVNKCVCRKSNSFFNSYFHIRDTPYNLRDMGMDIDFARTQIGHSTVKNAASRIWCKNCLLLRKAHSLFSNDYGRCLFWQFMEHRMAMATDKNAKLFLKYLKS